MRAAVILTASLLVIAGPLRVDAQDSHKETGKATVAEAISSAGNLLTGVTLPAPAAFVAGDREIAAGSTVAGPVAVSGTLKISGTITGDAFTYGGDIIVLAGGHVSGSAVALDGKVRLEGGDVDGERFAIGGALGPVATTVAEAPSTSHNVALSFGWAGAILIIGIGVLVFGGRTLDIVGATADREFGRSFLVGIGATLAIVPVLALLCIGLALTILGVLLIPFAIVAYILAVMGVVALGFLVAVRMTGHALGRRSDYGLSDRGAALRAIVIGVAFYLGLWVVAALVAPWPTIEWIARLVAFAATWAAATVGLGATIISRAGQRQIEARSAIPSFGATPLNERPSRTSGVPEWQTPTPVTGVVAAKRRPSAAHKS